MRAISHFNQGERGVPVLRIVIWIVVLCGLMSQSALALPGWAKKAEKNAREFEVDSRADHVELLHKREINYYAQGRTSTKVRRVYRILSVAGATEFMFQNLTSPSRKILKFRTWVRLRDGREYEMTEKSLNSQPISEDFTSYGEFKIVWLIYPGLQAGAVIAQEFEIEDSDLGVFFTEIIVQEQQPVAKFELKVRPPKNWEAFASGRGAQQVDFKRQRSEYQWTAAELAYQPDEPLMPSWDYVQSRIGISCYNPNVDEDSAGPGQIGGGHFEEWGAVSRWVKNIYDPKVEPDGAIKAIVDSLAGESSSRTELVRKIGAYIKKTIRYIAVEIGDGRFVPRSVAETLANGYGDCKDKTTLARSMLAAADIPSVATLASVDEPVNPYLPSPYQFDHCIVGVPLDDSLEFEAHAEVDGRRWMFFDPTDDITPVGELPAYLIGGTALVAAEDDSTLITLPYTSSDDWRRLQVLEGILAEDGSASADIRIIHYGSYAWYERAKYENQSLRDAKQEWREFLRSAASGAKLTTLSRNCEGDSCVVTLHVEIDNYAFKAGLEMFTRLDALQPAFHRRLVSPTRVHPIWFGPPSYTETIARWRLPEGMIVSSVFDPLTFESSLGKFDASFTKVGSTHVSYHSVALLNGKLLEADEYGQARELDRVLSEMSKHMFSAKPNSAVTSDKAVGEK